MIPAEIWRRNSKNVTKLFVVDSPVTAVKLDVAHQTADADYSNNSYPQTMSKSRLELYKSNYRRSNLMADMLRELHSDDDDAEGSDVPMEAKKGSDAKTKAPSDMKKPSDKADVKKTPKATDAEAKKSSLRKTLERMLER